MNGRFIIAMLAGAAAAAIAGCAQAPSATRADAAADAPFASAPRPRVAGTPGCPGDARDLPPGALYGRWEARIEGQPGLAVVELHKHPDYNGVRGTVARSGQRDALLAGDIDSDGLLSLDESQDGQTISANWSAPLQAASCGKVFEGSWRNAADDSVHPLVLQKK